MAASVESLTRTSVRNHPLRRQLAAVAASAQTLRHAQCLADGFRDYCIASHQLAHRAPEHFEHCDWQASQMDAVERNGLFERCVTATASALAPATADSMLPAAHWCEVQLRYAQLSDPQADALQREAFFRRVRQQVLAAMGATAPEADELPQPNGMPAPMAPGPALRRYSCRDSLTAAFRRLLADLPLDAEWQDMAASARQAAAAVPTVLYEGPRQEAIGTLELLPVVFYRFTRAYVLGRLVSPARGVPMAIAMTNTDSGAIVDDLLLGEATLGKLFKDPRTCFQLDPEGNGVAAYLRRLMPGLSAGDVAGSLGMPDPA